jgi:DNA-binding NarL/FixJ family response regulator
VSPDRPRTRVLLADDNAIVRQGLASVLEASGEVEVAGQAADGREAVRLAAELRPDLVLLDVRMPIMDGIEAAAALSATHRVVMLTYSEDEALVTGAIRAGASGYLVHGRFSAEELVRAVSEAVAGESPVSPAVVSTVFAALRDEEADGLRPLEPAVAEELSTREREIMALLAEGRSIPEIAGHLVLSKKTVKNHVTHIYGKLRVSSRAEATAAWLGTAREASG